MSSFSELIKNFERIRACMRDFYVYGFKSRGDYDRKSARSYDDDRRRIDSWLGDYMRFDRKPEGKSVFISIDSRAVDGNPLFKAWKAKSFTDFDITLHFILFDILSNPDTRLSLAEIIKVMDEQYLSRFDSPLSYDESTVRKKLKEYQSEGLIIAEKQGKRTVYGRSRDLDLDDALDAIAFFSESSPIGVVGSFILDGYESKTKFSYKHHYVTGTMDSDVLATLFTAMRKKCSVSVVNLARRGDGPKTKRLVPLKILISAVNGRQHLIAYEPEVNNIKSYRLDYLSGVRILDYTPRFDELRERYEQLARRSWGVYTRQKIGKNQKNLEHVEFTVRIGDGEDFIVNRLNREKRCGVVEKIDDEHYRFSADVFDSHELNPWVRTFLCRIVQMNYSNRTVENQLKDDLMKMYRMYGIEEDQ